MRWARALPFQELTPRSLARSRELSPAEPVYLISARGTLAQLAAEKLEAAGLNNCAVVEGGMQGWERNGLPVDRSRHLRAWLTEHRKRMIDTGMVTDVCDTGTPS